MPTWRGMYHRGYQTVAGHGPPWPLVNTTSGWAPSLPGRHAMQSGDDASSLPGDEGRSSERHTSPNWFIDTTSGGSWLDRWVAPPQQVLRGSSAAGGQLAQKTYLRMLSAETHLMYDLTGFQRDLLYVIGGLEEPHGLVIKDELESYYEKAIQHGRLYPILDTLVEKGEKDHRTNVYTITKRGRREIDARRRWEQEYLTARTRQ